MPEFPASSQPAALRILQPCDLSEVRATADAVRAFLVGRGCEAVALADLELVLVEGCNNAIKYAPSSARMLPLIVECLSDGNTVELRIHDHTAGFDWPAKTALPAPESEGGRGLFLMSTLMDEANYFRASGENILVLRKELHSVCEPPAPTTDPDKVIAELVEELSSCYESLSAIFRYSAARTGGGELRDFAQRLLADLQQIVGADWFVLRLKAGNKSQLEVFVASEPALQLPALASNEDLAANLPVELAAATSRRDVWFDAAQPLRTGDPLAVKSGSCGFAHPIFAGEDLVGTLAIGKSSSSAQNNPRGAAFTAGHTNVVGTFSEFLAGQVLNARIQEEQVARRIVEHELAIASSIQLSLLPRELSQLPGVQLAASCRSAQQVGGDFYDVLRVSDHELLFVIADVMGKGVPAAMFAAILRTLVRALPELTRQPAALLARINRLLFDELSGVDMFITAQLVCFDARAGRLTAASAGHCPLLVASPAGDAVQEILPAGMPLGVQVDTRFTEEMLQLPAQARVLIYTDGLSEALNPQGERFGQERLAEWFQAVARGRQSAEELKQSLTETLRRFQSNQPLNDDQTFLIMARQNP